MKLHVPLLVMVSLIASGCASYGGYKPVLDPKTDPNPHTIEADLRECGVLAKDSAETMNEATKGSVVGGAIGAVTGAVIGAVTGSPGRGAATGAAIGGGVGGVKGGMSAEEKYKRVYRNCMRNRGHVVLD